MKIGIVGQGVVGKALRAYYEGHHELWTYDIKTDSEDDLAELNTNSEVVFICVGTPTAKNWHEGLDCSQVYAAVDRLTGSKTVIIKSTVMPGTTDAIQAKHPEHCVFFVPEFLDEDTAVEDYAHPRRPHVIGYPVSRWTARFSICEYHWYRLLPERCASRHDLPAKQAELLKLATNAFYALKVTFANQMYDAGMTQEALDAMGCDFRITPWGFKIEHKGFRGFGGSCLPKDTSALREYIAGLFHDQELRYHLVMAAHMYNFGLLERQGLKPL